MSNIDIAQHAIERAKGRAEPKAAIAIRMMPV
jgi:hypothetical protein